MEVEAKTNGACLASFFEMIACAPNDLEGLVIGVQPQVTKSTLVTDAEIAKEKVVCVHSKHILKPFFFFSDFMF